jgi:hypothetical protein
VFRKPVIPFQNVITALSLVDHPLNCTNAEKSFYRMTLIRYTVVSGISFNGRSGDNGRAKIAKRLNHSFYTNHVAINY